MWFRSFLKSLKSRPSVATFRHSPHRPRTARLGVEVLDDRCLPSTFTVTNLLDSGAGSLQAAVSAANANPGADAIDFAVTGTIGLTSGQQDITDSLTINGPGASALTVSGNYYGRVFGIAGNPTVTIAGLTIANGWSGEGGGLYVAGGTVTLDHVTVSGNYAVGIPGVSPYDPAGDGLGGGIYVAGGTLTLDQSTVSGNYAIGGAGFSDLGLGYNGGNGTGGGLLIAGGTVHVNQSTLSGNVASGGAGGDGLDYSWEPTYGGPGGSAAGGGISVAAGSLEIRQSSIFNNRAFGGLYGLSYFNGGYLVLGRSAGVGGGLIIANASPPLPDLDSFTESNTVNNLADIDPNISGPYTVNGTWIPPLTISGGVSTPEGNSGTHAVTFTVSLSAASNQTITVAYATADGTATAGSDYQSTSGTLTIPAGQTSGTITVLVNGDRLAEANETFVVNLSGPTNATIANGRGVGTIVDDEPRISIGDVSKKEGRKNHTTLFTFTVTLSAAYDQAVTMSFRTTDGTAKTGDQDYVGKTGTITFAPGETSKTITIVVNGDSKKESNEYFYLDLFDNSSNSLFTKSRGTGTILNDD